MTEHAAAPESGELRHRPWLAALLSFVIPGMGQAYAGRPMLGLVMALPILLAGRGHRRRRDRRDRRLSEPAVRERLPRRRARAQCARAPVARDRDRACRAHALGPDPGPRPARGGHGRVRTARPDRRDACVARAGRGPVRHDAHAGLRDGASDDHGARRCGRCRRESRGAGQHALVRVGRHRADQHPPARDRCGPWTRHRPHRRHARRQRGPGREDRGHDQRPARHRLCAAARRDAIRRRALPGKGQRARDAGRSRPGDVVPRHRRRRGGVRPADGRALDRSLPRDGDPSLRPRRHGRLREHDRCDRRRGAVPGWPPRRPELRRKPDEPRDEQGPRPRAGVPPLRRHHGARLCPEPAGLHRDAGRRAGAADRLRPLRAPAAGPARDAPRADGGRYLPRAATAAGRHRSDRQHRLPARPGRRLREPPAADRGAGHRARRARLSRVRRPAARAGGQLPARSRSATRSGRRWRGSSASTSSRAGTWDRPRPVRPETRPPGRRHPSERRRAGPRSPRGRPRRR